jgi:2-polyprenyl-3-methyl-5-hydroxy-6-metoxy-1,4-benzoquinol methylase
VSPNLPHFTACASEAPIDAAAPAVTRCTVCGGERFVAAFGNGAVPAAARGQREAYRITHSHRDLVRSIMRCCGCGLGVLPVALLAVTESTYVEAEDPTYVEQAEDRIYNAGRLLQLLPAVGRLLDVGCACGFLLAAARRRGFTVQGVEPSLWAADYARRQFGLPVWCGSLEEAPFEPGSFEAIVLADTIEHLRDPRGAVAAAHRWLVPGGHVMLLTPDFGSPVARLLGRHWWALMDDHYYYFTRSTLRRLLESEGFVVERIAAFGRVFPLSHWVFKLSQYGARLHTAVQALTRAMRIERLRLPLNLGDQMVCVAHKQAN